MLTGYAHHCSEGLLSHNIVEILARDLLVVGTGSLQHLDKLFLAHSFAKLLRHAFDIVNIDEAGAIVVEQVEYLVYAALRYLLSIPSSLCHRA